MHPAVGILAVVGGVKALERLTTTKHDRLLKKSVKKVYRESSSKATLYVDHIDTSKSDGNPDGVLDEINGVPDVILQDFPSHLVVEVEDADGLKSPGRVIDQLEDFDVDGYTAVLVVPNEKETLAVGEEIASRADATVTVTTAKGLQSLV